MNNNIQQPQHLLYLPAGAKCKRLDFHWAGGAARHFSANDMPFAGAEIFVREHACVRAENFFGHFLICGAEF